MKKVQKGGYSWGVTQGTIVQGFSDITVSCTNSPIGVMQVPLVDCILDPKNPRLGELTETLGYSQKDQKKISSFLQSDRLEEDYLKLDKSWEHAGGQNEFIFGQFQNGRLIVKEGNRRLTVAQSRGVESLNVIVYPDEMSQDIIDDHITQRHVAGISQWTSVVRSKIAYEYLVEKQMSIDKIVSLLQFSTKRAAMKFINAYIWFRESGSKKESDWSTFYHALEGKRLRNLFGYDPDFWEKGTTPFSGDRSDDAEEIDEKIAKAAVKGGYIPLEKKHKFKADFPWFVNLIKKGYITHCLHSNALAKYVKYIDTPATEKALELLHTFVPPSLKKGSAAAIAEIFWKANNTKISFDDEVLEFNKKLDEILKSAKKRQEYSVESPDNDATKSSLLRTIALIKKLLGDDGIKMAATL